MKPYSLKEILKMEVAPALGCTEPVAIALAAAAAASLLSRPAEFVEVWVDPNVYKNAFNVKIPGTDGMHGLDLAAALGALGGDPALKMEVLSPVDRDLVERAKQMLVQGRVKVHLLEERGLHIKAEVSGGGDLAQADITQTHDNIADLKFNGEEVTDSPLLLARHCEESGKLEELEAWLRSLSMEDLIELLDQLDRADLQFIQQGIDYNTRLADYGIKHGSGLAVGKTMDSLMRQRMMSKDMIQTASMLAAAAADARMDGVKMPAMSSGGSGNHGLTAVLPIWGVKDFIECDPVEVLKAVALSHLVTAYVKAHTGRLSAVCGCSVAAGAGAAAGVTYLLGGKASHVSGAVKNVIEDLAGVICDGAKSACAIKLSTAAGAAVKAALFTLQGLNVQDTDGIVAATMEQTTRNLGILSTRGMIETDRTILHILIDHVEKEGAN
ncbi:MAG: L-serine ammonia-lyase, iron-sulfur-dependent, subunit alpha [Deltaproteobacteria bacterium]|nr:L-serine ammonia-lyase, iron-sulfur-dependent, subunit alpha [Deltaproteobacteria bacterium]